MAPKDRIRIIGDRAELLTRSSGGGEIFVTESVQEEEMNVAGTWEKYQPSKTLSNMGGHMSNYGRLMLIYGKNHHNVVK